MNKPKGYEFTLDLIKAEGYAIGDNEGFFLPSGKALKDRHILALVADGLLRPRGDGLFAGHSQTYEPIEEKHVQECT